VHPTQKPVKLFEWIVRKFDKEGTFKTVLDLFGGSGSTLIGAEQLCMTSFLMELDEKYVDVIVNRYISFKETGEDVFLIRDGVQIPYKEVEKI
jgi:DNA modification methylase